MVKAIINRAMGLLFLMVAMALGSSGCVLEANPNYRGADMAMPLVLPEVMIQGDTFKMGTGVDGGSANEKPEYTVDLGSFYLEKTEVTVTAYQKCVEAKVCSVPHPHPDMGESADSQCNYGVAGKEMHPVNCVDWMQADLFCRWNLKALPTEEQWEYAARGTTKSEYPLAVM